MKAKFRNYSTALFFGVVFGAILFQNALAQSSEVEWKKKYDFNQTKEKFEEPPLFYAPHTFWFWDTALDTAQIASMAREITKQRLNPGYAHPRDSESAATSFPALPREEWLSPLWFESIESAVKEAAKAGMTLGYCDEYMWPSGRADGRVLDQAPELVAKSLVWNKKISSQGKTVKLPESKFTVVAKLSNSGLLISNTLKIIERGDSFNWEVPEGKWVIYSYSVENSSIEIGKVNYLDPKLMDVFIPIAHKSYLNSVGQYMVILFQAYLSIMRVILDLKWLGLNTLLKDIGK